MTHTRVAPPPLRAVAGRSELVGLGGWVRIIPYDRSRYPPIRVSSLPGPCLAAAVCSPPPPHKKSTNLRHERLCCSARAYYWNRQLCRSSWDHPAGGAAVTTVVRNGAGSTTLAARPRVKGTLAAKRVKTEKRAVAGEADQRMIKHSAQVRLEPPNRGHRAHVTAI